jgi:outer membrane receptor protein involved in Fe transport
MINRNRVRVSKLALGLAIALAAAPAFAQNTSSAIGGTVSDASGNPVAGAQVTIVHTESGTASQATTGADGRYIARGLRVGGPYTITITKDGKTEKREGVYLALAETNNIDAKLDDAAALAAVQVVGTTLSVFSPTKMGTGTNVSREQIEGLPSATRNIQDYIRLDPRITQVSKADGAISAGGQNTRYNSIKIDGVGAGDPFGLESNNLPTERQPVSIDALEALNIAVADYDVTIAGGVGAVVNAVTKSGTNEYHGSLYYAFRDKDWVRQDLRGVEFNGFESETTYGATFGGPILKDRLFFFANYEKYTRKSPGVGLGDTPFGVGSITAADITAVQTAATAKGFDAGDLNPVGANTEIEEKAIKLDWNINDNHRASLRYSETDQTVVRFPELDSNSVSLSSFWYSLPKSYDATVLELFSDWSESFSTEFKLSNRGYSAERVTFSHLPSIRINGYGPTNSAIFLGTEQNSHINIVDTNQDSAFGAANWYVGDHVVKGGFDYEKNDIVNFFGRNVNGVYEFANLAGFIAGTPTRYIVRVPVPGGSLDDIPAEYSQENLALFLQDTWTVNNNLTLTLGVRWDKPSYDAQTKHNTFIEGIYGYDNTEVLDASLFQPRAGFNYTFDTERPTQLRGGIGLFQGASPNVWMAGIYQNTGLNYLEYDRSNPGAIFTASIDPPFIPTTPPAASCFPTPTLAACARQNVDILEPGLAQPSSWKANLAFEHELPWGGVVFSAEYLRTKVKDAIYIERLDLFNAAGQGPTRTGPDGRNLFWNPAVILANAPTGIGSISSARFNRPNGVGDVLLLKNTDKGESEQFTIGLDRPMQNDWSWSAAYTFTEATEVSPLTSSINASNWNNSPIFNANENVANDSRYAIKHRATGTLNWQHAFFGDYKTKVGLFYEGRTGRPYSLVFANDMNGDGTSSTNDLFYIPNPGEVKFTGGAAMETAFFAWLNDHPDYKRYQGSVAPANAFRAKFTHNFDLRVSQEVPGFMDGHKVELSLDFNNIGNMINKKWGLIEDFGFFSTARVAQYRGVCTAVGTGTPGPTVCSAADIGKYVYTYFGADVPQIQENNNDKGNTAVSRWSILATLRYEF